jgi:hypothetical protein
LQGINILIINVQRAYVICQSHCLDNGHFDFDVFKLDTHFIDRNEIDLANCENAPSIRSYKLKYY